MTRIFKCRRWNNHHRSILVFFYSIIRTDRPLNRAQLFERRTKGYMGQAIADPFNFDIFFVFFMRYCSCKLTQRGCFSSSKLLGFLRQHVTSRSFFTNRLFSNFLNVQIFRIIDIVYFWLIYMWISRYFMLPRSVSGSVIIEMKRILADQDTHH